MSRQGNRSHRRDERSYAAQNGAQAPPPPNHANRRSDRDHASTNRASADHSNGHSNGHSSIPTYQTPPRSQDDHQPQQYNSEQYYHSVPRDWQAINPEAYQSIQDPALDSSPFASSPRYRGTSPANSHADEGASGQHGAPLNLSNLNQFNNTQQWTTNMAMWEDQSQRDGAYDGVGYVRSKEQGGHWRISNGY